MFRALTVALVSVSPILAQTVTFEELTFAGSSQYYNSSSFSSGGASFNNQYFPPSPPFGEYWTGFAYSKVKDVVTPGINAGGQVVNGHAAFYKPQALPADPPGFGAGAEGSANYAVGFDGSPFGLSPTITLPSQSQPLSLALTNTTYTAISLRDGDSFSKKFGGSTGNDPDYFKVVITGRDTVNVPTGSVEFYLADYRFANNADDYIVSQWTTVDLSSLGNQTHSIAFSFVSSDVTTDSNGNFLYYNTPLYMAVDNISFTVVPEPAGLVMLAVIMAGIRRMRFSLLN